MKVSLTKVATTEVEVEMPDVCPHCGANWKEVGAIECQMVPAAQGCSLFKGASHGYLRFNYYETSELFYESNHVTDYLCASCHEPLATIPEDPKQEKLQGV